MHITDTAVQVVATVAVLPGGLSDHALSMVVTDMHVHQGAAQTHQPRIASTRQVRWSRDPRLWREALLKDQKLAEHTATVLQQLVHEYASFVPHRAHRQAAVDCSTALVHLLYVHIGHTHGLAQELRTGSKRHYGDNKVDQLFVLEEQVLAHRHAERLAKEQPQNPELQANAIVQWAWLQQAQLSLSAGTQRTVVPTGFVAAVRGGAAEMERWVSSSSNLSEAARRSGD